MARAGDIRVAAALSGGGSKGAFQVGALLELEKQGVQIDAYAGISTGAVQAAAGAMGVVGELAEEWCGIRRNRDVHRKRWFGWMRRARYDASPLRNRLRRFAKAHTHKISKPLRVGVVSLQSGELRVVPLDALTPSDEVANWIYASCAIPTEYDPVDDPFPGGGLTQWVDGGARDVTPLRAAAGFKPRGVLMIRCHPRPAPPINNARFSRALAIGRRAIDLLQSEVSLGDLAPAEIARDLFDARDEIEKLLKEGSSPDDLRSMVRDQLMAVAEKNGLVRVLAIGPREIMAATNEYRPADIEAMIAAGRRAVADQLDEIKKFEELCRKETSA